MAKESRSLIKIFSMVDKDYVVLPLRDHGFILYLYLPDNYVVLVIFGGLGFVECSAVSGFVDKTMALLRFRIFFSL